MDLSSAGLKSLKKAISLIHDGSCNRVDLGHNTIAYKVPSPNLDKYTIRIDIKVNLKEEGRE